MGLSSKQVSRDIGVGWSQSNLLQAQTPMKRQQHPQSQQQQQTEPVNCPRCDSTNTKFCYYNNYNKSQPRHFCKACKRHWTKGGTLRNVPVGGGRKNKRIKTSNPNKSASSSAATPAIRSSNSSVQQQRQDLHHQLPPGDDHHRKNVSSNLQFRPPSSSLLQQNSIINQTNNGVFLCSTTSTLSNLPQSTDQGFLQFPFSISTSSSFETTPSSISTSFQSSSIYNYPGESMMEDPTTITNTASGGSFSLPWQVPITSSTSTDNMDMANYWNWDEIDALVSTNDLNVPWDDDDSEIKP